MREVDWNSILSCPDHEPPRWRFTCPLAPPPGTLVYVWWPNMLRCVTAGIVFGETRGIIRAKGGKQQIIESNAVFVMASLRIDPVGDEQLCRSLQRIGDTRLTLPVYRGELTPTHLRDIWRQNDIEAFAEWRTAS